MLVLSRQRDESIMIGDEVEITIVDVRGDKVRLGITYPKRIPVHRREIYDAIQREKAQQVQGDAQVHVEGAPREAGLEERNKGGYFNCCGAYGGMTATQGARRRVSSTGVEIYCQKRDSQGYCGFEHTGDPSLCPFSLEGVV